MKSGFTRTGQRTTAGVIDDTVKAIVRYYVNNYQDGRKQDAIDLLTGAYQPDGVHPPPLRPQLSPLTPLVLGLLGMGIGTHNLGQLLRYGSSLAAVATATTDISSSSGGQEGVLASMGMGTLTSLVSSVFLLPGFGVWGSSMGSPAAGPSPYLTVTSSPPDSMAAAAPHLDVGPLSGVVTLGMSHVVLPFALGLGLFALIVENGKRLVNKPQLCPQLAATDVRNSAQCATLTAEIAELRREAVRLNTPATFSKSAKAQREAARKEKERVVLGTASGSGLTQCSVAGGRPAQ
ncbi:SAC domain-containing protein [Haematococcus lacustris]|uniref:SAC domain-containing protein n=1 Tax=Haematococcus lacustris TaxID=44745 RepID=A0A699YW99_HAELA|nr:SAC domain-containing protein [Haematococcus lacustris]